MAEPCNDGSDTVERFGNPTNPVAKSARNAPLAARGPAARDQAGMGFGGAERVTIWLSGRVTDEAGEEIGNLYDED